MKKMISRRNFLKVAGASAAALGLAACGAGCLRICFMSIFAHSRLIYKFFPDKKKRGCREIDRPVCKMIG